MLSTIKDPRREHGKKHKLEDVLTIALCTVLCGYSEFTEMEGFGKLRYQWLKGFLELPEGIPSHDTFRNVLSAIAPSELLGAFTLWTSYVHQKLAGEVVAIDGKALRGTKGDLSKMVTIVGAWATGAGISLGQMQVAGKSNEITALPKLLEVLDIEGCTVTTDAMGCQREVAKKCIEMGADYVLAVKGNQPSLQTQVVRAMDAIADDEAPHHVEANRGHGRGEVRRCWVIDGIADWLEGHERWAGLRSIAVIESERTLKGVTSINRRYYISSLSPNAKKTSATVRSHWGVENSLHWVLDVIFGEDAVRARTKNAAGNLSSLRRLALNLFKTEEKYSDWSIKRRRLAAGIDTDYMAALLGIK
ncbi:MAG: ISAs1 family transposase [Verrucomicrobiales bacterium]|nr:ISAs1 family transposase [Verrucomicrobiales bacterium]